LAEFELGKMKEVEDLILRKSQGKGLSARMSREIAKEVGLKQRALDREVRCQFLLRVTLAFFPEVVGYIKYKTIKKPAIFDHLAAPEIRDALNKIRREAQSRKLSERDVRKLAQMFKALSWDDVLDVL